MGNINIPPPNVALIYPDGRAATAWYRYLVDLNTTADGAAGGTVATNPGSGLAGGGAVADGLDLQIADNGVSNAMIRKSAGTSVIGRAASSTGNVADITASLNNTVLVRQGNQLFFSQNLIVTGVEAANLTIDQTATASTATTTHSVPIKVGTTTYYLLVSATP